MRASRTERSIEQAVVAYAKRKGCESIKLSMLGPRGVAGWPDRIFLGAGCRMLWVEFKAAGGRVTERQQQRHRQLAALGWSVHVVYDVQHGKDLIDCLEGV